MRTKGFSLIELVVALSIIMMCSLIGISTQALIFHKNEHQVLIDDIKTAIQYAKTQAVILNHPVVLAPIEKAQGWSLGMVLSHHHKEQEEILYQWSWHHPNWSIQWVGAGHEDLITLSNNPYAAMSNGRFTLTNQKTRESVVIILNKLGRMRVKYEEI